MTALEQYTAALPTTVGTRGMSDAASSLVEWARQADAAYSLAQRIAGTSFVPQQFRGKPEEAAAAILAGAEVGLSPMASLSAFDVIQGRATPRAITLRAVAQARGCEIVVDEATGTRCKMRGRRRGDSEWTSVVWDIGRAQALGLMQKDQWRKQPVAMLLARATSELCRLIAADAVLGLAYTAEEMYDEVGTAEPRKVQRAKVQRLPVATPEPDFDEPAAPQEEALPESDDTPDPITGAQLTALNAALTQDYDLTDRAAKLAWLTQKLGRDIATSKDVLKTEASRLLDELNDAGPPEPEFDEPTLPGADE